MQTKNKEYNPLKLEWSAVADTEEQFMLFADFIKAFKEMKDQGRGKHKSKKRK